MSLYNCWFIYTIVHFLNVNSGFSKIRECSCSKVKITQFFIHNKKERSTLWRDFKNLLRTTRSGCFFFGARNDLFHPEDCWHNFSLQRIFFRCRPKQWNLMSVFKLNYQINKETTKTHRKQPWSIYFHVEVIKWIQLANETRGEISHQF